MVLGGRLWLAQQAWTFSGPSEKPADTSSRKVEGFYLGCRWIASPKDIPVPEKVLKRIERLRGGPMIESEKDIQILISEWQKGEFQRLKKETEVKGDNLLVSPHDSAGNCTNDDLCCRTLSSSCTVCGQEVCCTYTRVGGPGCCFRVECDDGTVVERRCFVCA
ncbi:MAG: hypothetical protein V2G48_07910 [bacterium JZ-2024 1]